MRRRDLLKLLLSVAAAPALVSLGSSRAAAQEGTGDPAQPPWDRNNIVGLNVARLKQPLYIWAASDLVNANGGDWGYITVVWTIQDREERNAEYNLQMFLDRCFEFHLQPIIRLATKFEAKKLETLPGEKPVKPNEQGAEGSWARPDWDEPAKWRAYFEAGNWPTRQAWIVVGNEPNLGREWGGEVDAAGYARYLAHFLDVFQGASRFDVVAGALDISNTTAMPVMQDAFEFLDGMAAAVPGIFERLPAWASNPYKQLGRGRSVRFTHRAYEAELDHIGREMPVLITEAGHLDTGDDDEIARFYQEAFTDWMADPKVIAATPLFWHPDRNDFWMFELDKRGAFVHKSPTYELMRRLPRVAGSPQFGVTLGNVARTTPFEDLTAIQAADAEDADAPDGQPTQPLTTERPGDTWELDGKTATSAAPVAVRAEGGRSDPTFAPPGQTGIVPDVQAMTAAGQPMRIANTGGAGARLRSAPSRQADSVVVLPDDTVVKVIGPERQTENERWQQVRADDGTEGWVASDLLTPAQGGGQ
jgi:hypothetical protein